MPEMIFPDNRFKSPTSYSGLGDFGLTYACDEVRDAMDELEPLLSQAKAAKLLTTHVFSADEGHPIAVNAEAVYRQARNSNIIIFSDDACDDWSSRLKEASAKLRELLQYQNVADTSYVPPEDSPYRDPGAPDTLDKLKPLFIAGAVIAGVVLLVPITFELVGISRTIRASSRRRR